MSSIAEVLLIELLRKEGVITDNQAVTLVSIKTLFGLVEQMKVIPPFSAADKKVIREWEEMIGGSQSSKIKVEKILAYNLEKVENPTLKRILESLRDKVKGLKLI